MKIQRIATLALLAATFFIISACGGGGGGASTPAAPPTKATVKLATSGALAVGTSIGAIDTTINYSTVKGLSIVDGDVVTSGVAAGALIAPNTLTYGQVRVAGITGSGFPVGEFATLTFNIAPGFSPLAGDFTVAPGTTSIYDSTVNPLGSVTVVIQSVTFQ